MKSPSVKFSIPSLLSTVMYLFLAGAIMSWIQVGRYYEKANEAGVIVYTMLGVMNTYLAINMFKEEIKGMVRKHGEKMRNKINNLQ